MLKAILFDLDGTLLPIDIDRFLEKYFKALAPSFAELFNPKDFLKQVLASTNKMITNLDPTKTNQEIFVDDFYQATQVPPEVFMPIFDHFYANEFSWLGEGISPKPIVREIIKILAEKEYELVIATNPVFPLIAIQERMQWANIGDFAYSLITSFENMHYCKPNIEYYKEIMAMINAKPEDCLMIGNDVDEDLAAAKLGIKTFLVKDFLINRTSKQYTADFEGTLEDLFSFVKEQL